MYIYEREDWTAFRWDALKFTVVLEEVNRKQGLLYGRLYSLGFDNRLKAMAENLINDVVFSSEIEGIHLNTGEVRSSVARKLGLENVRQTVSSHYVGSIVAVVLGALHHVGQPLIKEKLCAQQAAFFPTGSSEGFKIEVGRYRTYEEHIVPDIFGREEVHYVAPAPERVEGEMEKFLHWFNEDEPVSSTIHSAIVHLWFVSIHPSEDGNGRLAHILSDMLLARADKSEFRFYDISSQISKDKNRYYEILKKTQNGDEDVTEWILWYANTLSKAFDETKVNANTISNKSLFWQSASSVTFSQRQKDALNLFLDDYEAKITSRMWVSLAKCSGDTAICDVQDLVAKGILREDSPGAKCPSYSIRYSPEDISECFSDAAIEEQDGFYVLTVTYKRNTPVRERLQSLDAERFAKGDLPLENLLDKYCSYMNMYPWTRCIC